MEDVLFLVHRIPWPPNKGDKIRSYHILRHLAGRYRVHLGTFVDDPADQAHVPELERLCASVCARPLPASRARTRALTGLLTGEPLTLPWYRDRTLQDWVDDTLARHRIRRALVFSSAMGQYLPDRAGELLRVVDFVDVDSDKWTQYAASKRWPMSALYRREGRRLLAYERRLAAASDASLFVSPAEAESFRGFAPESTGRVHALNNGVDARFFAPDPQRPSPYPPGTRTVVLTGAMDYWPNVDAACWFAEAVLPRLQAGLPGLQFHVVGSRPAPRVLALAQRPGVTVTGFVDDVRPWIQHAALAVAPLRIARGVQNKVLEAMALGRPVVATPQALEGLTARPGEDLLLAWDEPEAFATRVAAQLTDPDPILGKSARERVLADYDWDRNLAQLDALLDGEEAAPGVAGDLALEASHGR
ncbi:TIGR03087 family PEP-CTERM/XrtA system glycosyltransferase [Alkalilimnicola ehrlichii MLHE-1]|uniref:Glycosyl transferase, group 1 n=1 Tax=Alkalilimnicola ehrlichii (strain ATCC BAA-1101 / DSM 17681 / MLHE-1) TaxID=187272 RepID=Q0ACE1_ALKEH|nr:TIGR03087 family PEP-CTERM/XrtA system glycosyltransferase [Alkalilimnicola ehrlichii]ABI55496.1 glycosyl transferase, group 1 [Alkalilimnicola ehrlichii MLHE-1]